MGRPLPALVAFLAKAGNRFARMSVAILRDARVLVDVPTASADGDGAQGDSGSSVPGHG